MKSSTALEPIHVVVGVILNSNNEVLVSRRKANAHLGGFLEFPGGKVESKEHPLDALKRELREELAIELSSTSPLIQTPYRYPDRKLLLDVFLVNEYSGTALSNEGQELMWKHVDSLVDSDFPDANFGILRAISLPRIFPVTPELSGTDNFMQMFENVASKKEVELIQLRSHSLDEKEYITLAKKCSDICEKNNTKIILNRDVGALKECKASGLHLTSEKLLSLDQRPLGYEFYVGASCHNLAEVEKANQLKLDYILVGAVKEKIQDKNQVPLGWGGFAELTRNSQIPAYAIGGVGQSDIEDCVKSGGQGVAAIRIMWGN